jgi:cell division protein FtsL
MYCKKCGTKNKDDARFCANCGEKLVIPSQQQAKQQPAQPKQQIYTESQNEPKRSSKSWIIAFACVIVVVVVIFGFQYFKSEDKKEATATTENKTSAKTTENNAGEDVADAKDSTEKSQVLSYTDNEDMDLSACTDSDDYQYVSSEDNSFEFAYPKYLFNRSYVNKTGNQYTLEYANSDKADDYEIKAVISSQKAGSGNAVKSVQKLYKQKKKSIKNVTYAYPQGGKTPKRYQGKSSMIVMGYLDSDKTKCEYVLLTSDGKKDYMMQINFFDSDYKDEYKEINYVVDCMYRGCSFTNSTYQMRTFDQFREDDMGVKK